MQLRHKFPYELLELKAVLVAIDCTKLYQCFHSKDVVTSVRTPLLNQVFALC